MAGRRGGPPAPVWVRFWAKVERTPDCWNWIGALNAMGYGIAWDGANLVLAHRLSYLLHGLLIPEGLVLDHLCRNRGCVRPDHLEAVTISVNNTRAWVHRARKPKASAA